MKKIILILISCFLFFSCLKKEEEVIILDKSEPLALAPDVQWAVVNEPYVAFKEDKDWGASVTGHCRKGDILQIKGKSIDSKKEIWYLFDDGWLPASCLLVYNNRLKAQNYEKSEKKQ